MKRGIRRERPIFVTNPASRTYYGDKAPEGSVGGAIPKIESVHPHGYPTLSKLRKAGIPPYRLPACDSSLIEGVEEARLDIKVALLVMQRHSKFGGLHSLVADSATDNAAKNRLRACRYSANMFKDEKAGQI